MTRSPLLIIGLDGASFNLLDPLMASGTLPNLQHLAETGVRTELLSTLPVATLPAWTSFLTARHPAQHGVTDMFMRGSGYALVPATGHRRRVPTFLADLAARGLRVASVSVPGTFPPEPLANGLCIAGFDAPGSRRVTASGVWPASLRRTLRHLGGWRYAVFNEHQRHNPSHIRDVLLRDLAAKERVILQLYRQAPWDVFFVHLQASDTVAHHLWHTHDVHSPRFSGAHDGISAVYQRLDQLIGALLASKQPDTRVMVVSDHGMGGAGDWAVHINRYLHTLGFLHFDARKSHPVRQKASKLLRRALGKMPTGSVGWAWRAMPEHWLGTLVQAARGSAVDFARSVAFSDELDYAPSIWLHRRGAFPDGRLSQSEAMSLTATLETELRRWRHPISQAPIFAAVHRRDQLPAGPHGACHPDLVLEPAWPGGYRPSFLPSPGPGPAVRRLHAREFAAPRGCGMPGVHRRAGVFLFHGPRVPAVELPAMHIHEAGALVYALAGAPLPADSDAKFPIYLREACGIDALATAQEPGPTPPTVDAYDPAHSVDLMARLSDMGYL